MIFLVNYTFCVNFIEIRWLLRVSAIQVKNVPPREVPLPLDQSGPFSIGTVLGLKVMFCLSFIQIGWDLLELSWIHTWNYDADDDDDNDTVPRRTNFRISKKFFVFCTNHDFLRTFHFFSPGVIPILLLYNYVVRKSNTLDSPLKNFWNIFF